MSLVNLRDYKAYNATNTDSDEVLLSRLGVLSGMVSRYCNQSFAHSVSRIVFSGAGDVTMTMAVPGHSMRAGGQLKVQTSTGVDEFWTVAAVTPESITVTHGLADITAIQAALDVDGYVTDADFWMQLRQVHTVSKTTRGGDKVYLNPLPIAEIVSVSTTQDEDVIDSTDYLLQDVRDGVSFMGEVAFLVDKLPIKYRECLYANGVQVSYVSGELFPPAALQGAVLQLMKDLPGRLSSGSVQSKSFEGYSTSRISSDEIGKLFGEADQTLEMFRIPVI